MTSRSDVKAMDHAAEMLTYNTRKTTNADTPTKPERGRNSRTAVQTVVSSIGPILRERREAMGVTLAEAEVATRIRQKYLAALESDEWDLLPGEVVGRGFLRNYSTYLGIEPNEMIDRRRAIADDSLASVLAETSAGSPLPPDRPVDYRPKDVALLDESNELETPRRINLLPVAVILAVIAVGVAIWWTATQFGESISSGVASLQQQIVAWQQAPEATPADVRLTEDATLPDNLVAPPAVVAESAAPTSEVVVEPTVASQPLVEPPPAADSQPVEAAPTPQPEQAQEAAPAVEAPGSLLALLPTPTPQAEIVAEPPAPAGEPALPATVITAANLRQGPSTDFPVVAAAAEGDTLTIVGRNADSTWYQLESGAWIFGQLVNNPPVDAPVVEVPAAP